MDQNQEVGQSDEQALGRKTWHAPAVRWHSSRDAEHNAGGLNDGATSGSTLS